MQVEPAAAAGIADEHDVSRRHAALPTVAGAIRASPPDRRHHRPRRARPGAAIRRPAAHRQEEQRRRRGEVPERDEPHGVDGAAPAPGLITPWSSASGPTRLTAQARAIGCRDGREATDGLDVPADPRVPLTRRSSMAPSPWRGSQYPSSSCRRDHDGGAAARGGARRPHRRQHRDGAASPARRDAGAQAAGIRRLPHPRARRHDPVRLAPQRLQHPLDPPGTATPARSSTRSATSSSAALWSSASSSS